MPIIIIDFMLETLNPYPHGIILDSYYHFLYIDKIYKKQ